MVNITLICVGKMKEKHFISAADEYIKRLGAYCRLEVIELSEARLPQSPTDGEISAALKSEADAIAARIPKGAGVIAMCIEGKELSSEALSETVTRMTSSGVSKLCFIIGGSFGLHESVKKSADLRLSMSPMTFPHHLARVMLLEQIYRAFKIAEGGRYHK
ncbi:MAG: 23S rRNA (pseudouridine(1915)-N(3))-methyltransferase RlmH [Oscillospiraceae bacterium]|nr:23S rRNA (pseudouridine(1915)-N(3))-methyltransferase RlmH [Oscillospiraceae bacterium]